GRDRRAARSDARARGASEHDGRVDCRAYSARRLRPVWAGPVARAQRADTTDGDDDHAGRWVRAADRWDDVHWRPAHPNRDATRRTPAARSFQAPCGEGTGNDAAEAKRQAMKAPHGKQAPEEARGRTPTPGAEVTAGSAVAETGARG